MMEVVNHKGFDISIMNDECPINPFVDWDMQPTLMVCYDRSIETMGESVGFPYLDNSQIIENKKYILELLGYASLLELCRDINYSESACDTVNYALEQHLEHTLGYSDELAAFSELLTMTGVHNSLEVSRGCSQGDYAEVLVVCDSDFFKRTECDKGKVDIIMQSAHDLFTAWAWGDVYAFIIDAISDSCYGFYGYDHEKSGLLDEARGAIDWHIKVKRKAHFKELKAWIRNKVSFEYRTANNV